MKIYGTMKPNNSNLSIIKYEILTFILPVRKKLLKFSIRK